jgi:hypothetical protein
VADVAQDVWSIAVMFFVLPTRCFPGPPLPSDAKYRAFASKDIRSSRLWSSLAPSLVQVCCSPSTAHLSSPQFLHKRVFVSQEKRCTVSDVQAMLSIPWFLESVLTSLEPSITPSPTLSPHVMLSLSPQFFTKSSVDESKSSQPPCKPRRSCLGFGRWSLKTTAEIARATSRKHHSVRALTL